VPFGYLAVFLLSGPRAASAWITSGLFTATAVRYGYRSSRLELDC